jgi:catechol 2,3-dioxygenase-like lactoylglutathione lyase family enzyme
VTDERQPVRFDRTMIYVSDLKRSVSFYTTLGLTIVTEDDEVVRLADDGGATVVLHVIEHDWEQVTRGCRFYFATADADAVFERLRLAHPEATVLQPVRLMAWGRRHGYLLDPDGWELSIYEPEAAGA